MIENKYNIGDIVYLITDDESKKRIVYAIKVLDNGMLVYEVACGTEYSSHYDFELKKVPEYEITK